MDGYTHNPDNTVPHFLAFYKLLGGLGVDGIKYIWKKKEEYIESLAFNRRLKRERNPSDSTTSAYTISTSIGCVLSKHWKTWMSL